MMSWRGSAVSSSVSGTTLSPFREAAFPAADGGRLRDGAIGCNGGRYAVVVASKTGAGLQAIDEREDPRAFNESGGVAADLAGERNKDAMNLSLLFFDQAHQLVVLLDGFERLDVDRLSRGADAMDDAGDAALQLGANGNHEALAANGDQVFLRRAFWRACAVRSGGFFDQTLLALLLAANSRSSGEALSASEPSGWMVRSMDSASGRRRWSASRRG